MSKQAARPEGWYADPYDPSRDLYWDGAAWDTTNPVPAGTHRRRRRRAWLLIALAVLVVVLAAGGLGFWLHSRPGAPMTVRGEVVLHGTEGVDFSVPLYSASNFGCIGVGDYSDLTAGAPVIVTSPSGQTLATGKIQDGVYVDGTDACVFVFEVDHVPANHARYGLAIAHRDKVTFSRAAMKKGPTVTIKAN